MMMMNFFMSRTTTTTSTTCYPLLLVLLVASLTFGVSSVNAKKGMANTMPEDNKVISRVLTEESNKLMYSKTYIVVTKAADFVRLFSNGGDIVTYLQDFITKAKAAVDTGGPTFKGNPEFPIQGSSTTQKGAVFDSSSIEVVNAPDGVVVEVGFGKLLQVQFSGNRKIKFTPVDDPFYFFHGHCIVNSGFLEPSTEIRTLAGPTVSIPQPVITSESCKLNLCLGGGGFSCIAIYSGSSFMFNFGKGVALNNEGVSTALRLDLLTFEGPPLPPPFPGTIIGGTGPFEGIEGSVTIATIAGTTGPILKGIPVTFKRLKPIGSIVQVILVKSNMPLPAGP